MLRFSFGLMNSGKSLNLIALYYSLKTNKKTHIGIFAPEICANQIISRSSLQLEIDAFITNESRLDELCAPFSFILVDEVQFCLPHQIDQLRILADKGANVYCFGLLTNWKLELFPAAKRLVEIADCFFKCEQLPNVCSHCGQRPAIGHFKQSSSDMSLIQLDTNIYSWCCFSCHQQPRLVINQP